MYRFQPYNINGWFWAATLGTMGQTNVFNGRKFNGWSGTGPSGRAQPDGILKQDGFGEQACMAVLDNFFNDGLSWHDTKLVESTEHSSVDTNHSPPQV